MDLKRTAAGLRSKRKGGIMTTLRQEREQLYFDLWEGKRPKRVPIEIMANLTYAIEYLGYSLKRELYSPEKCVEAAEKMAELIDSDNLPTMPNNESAVFRYTKAQFMVPGNDGFFQHPNISPMTQEEYPEFSKDPLGFIVKKIQPRVFGILQEDPEFGQIRINIARNVVAGQFAGQIPRLLDKYQRSGAVGVGLLIWAPFDFLADYIRSFSNVLLDIRKKPEWVLEACEAILEYELKQVEMLPNPRPGSIPTIMLPLHMAPFMKPADFEKFYWPTYKRLVEGIQERGYQANMYCEENWTPHLEALNELPGRCLIAFETSDPKKIVQQVSTKHIFANGYPTELLKTGSKQQCIDKAKELLDIMAPGGNYIFAITKPFLRKNDTNMDNVQALVDFVKEYGIY